MVRFFVALSTFAAFVVPWAAFACQPAPRHSASIVERDTPECLSVHSAADSVAYLGIQNECDDSVRIAALDCDACGDPVEIEPGDYDTFVLEDRELEDGSSSSQTIRWSMGAEEGTISTSVEYREEPESDDLLSVNYISPPTTITFHQ